MVFCWTAIQRYLRTHDRSAAYYSRRAIDRRCDVYSIEIIAMQLTVTHERYTALPLFDMMNVLDVIGPLPRTASRCESQL